MTQISNESVKKGNTGGGLANIMAGIAVVICIAIGFAIWSFVLGSPDNFQGGNPDNEPLPGNLLGMMYKGGPIIGLLLGLLTTTFVFGIERFIVISSASGSGNIKDYVSQVRTLVNDNEIDEAIELSDKQKGSVANVIRAGLIKLKEAKREGLDTEKATELLHKEIEEATVLEMPMLERNMIILATLVSIGTLVGLLGTVTGMIKAFAALSTAGSPDSAALATGISEALMCTATGISTSTLAIVFYNVFTTKIDKLTHFIDEAGFAITQSYKRK